MLVLEGVVGLHRNQSTSASLASRGWGIDLDNCDIEWFALETNRDHSVTFRLQPSTAFETILLNMRATPFLLRESCPQ